MVENPRKSKALTGGVEGALDMHKYFTICINVILLFQSSQGKSHF